ncbi:alpha-N-acetylneuraminide alpha-2,8-sialyltransferase-like [Asterias rubens]|uniref:alpha-N-acetylneuraminide alpha-2,8-sialyltransferase-like n=1 Tax=Asterias rubens TaxID=7604 RepID=UPI001454F537|nr:alpha-N-acetylneuraminide alpha-2,8-sialyltransferase-like [Asterias rubens]
MPRMMFSKTWCNMVPIKKFSEDAGLKTNFTTMNPSIYGTRYNYFKRDSDIEKFNFDLKEYSGNLFLPCLMYSNSANSCFKKVLPAIHNTNGRLTTRVGNSEHLLGILQKWKSSGIHLMSTGFYLTQTAITLCNEVHLFGFWSFSKAMYPVPRELQYHFFDDMKQSKAHSFNTEFQLLWQLHVNGIINIHVNDCDG